VLGLAGGRAGSRHRRGPTESQRRPRVARHAIHPCGRRGDVEATVFRRASHRSCITTRCCAPSSRRRVARHSLRNAIARNGNGAIVSIARRTW
jgi:hypothetical protein